MSAATLIERARVAGVTLAVSEAGTLRVVGDRVAVERWLPVLRANKAGIVKLLSEPAPNPPGSDSEAFEERAAIREYDAGYERRDAELLAAWELTQALFRRLTAGEYRARCTPGRLPAGDSADSDLAARLPPRNDPCLDRQRRGGGS
jgi:hypothetical protein